MKKITTVTLKDDLLKVIRERAKLEGRSVANFVRQMLWFAIQNDPKHHIMRDHNHKE